MKHIINQNLILFKDLQAFTGYKPMNKVIEVLRENGIKYAVVNKGVSTTIDAINKGLGVSEEIDKREFTL